MQIAYHQQYKDLDDRQIIDLVLSGKNVVQIINQRANMDIPLALNDIRIRHGLKGYRRKSSTFSLQTDVVGLSAYSYNVGYFRINCFINEYI